MEGFVTSSTGAQSSSVGSTDENASVPNEPEADSTELDDGIEAGIDRSEGSSDNNSVSRSIEPDSITVSGSSVMLADQSENSRNMDDGRADSTGDILYNKDSEPDSCLSEVNNQNVDIRIGSSHVDEGWQHHDGVSGSEQAFSQNNDVSDDLTVTASGIDHSDDINASTKNEEINFDTDELIEESGILDANGITGSHTLVSLDDCLHADDLAVGQSHVASSMDVDETEAQQNLVDDVKQPLNSDSKCPDALSNEGVCCESTSSVNTGKDKYLDSEMPQDDDEVKSETSNMTNGVEINVDNDIESTNPMTESKNYEPNELENELTENGDNNKLEDNLSNNYNIEMKSESQKGVTTNCDSSESNLKIRDVEMAEMPQPLRPENFCSTDEKTDSLIQKPPSQSEKSCSSTEVLESKVNLQENTEHKEVLADNIAEADDVDEKSEKNNGLLITNVVGGLSLDSQNGSPKPFNDSQQELKGYAADAVNEFLGIFGMDGLDEKETEKLSVSKTFSQNTESTSSADGPSSSSRQSATTDDGDVQNKPVKPSSSKPAGGKPVTQCLVCKKVNKCKYNIVRNGGTKHLCDDNCFKLFRAHPSQFLKSQATSNPKDDTPTERPVNSNAVEVQKLCAVCKKSGKEVNKQFLSWQNIDFCGENCLGKFQAKMNASCCNCGSQISAQGRAKFCIKVGTDVKQFCQQTCLDEFKSRLKLCSFCQKDVSKNKDSFMAPVSSSGEFKDFCSQICMQKYEDKKTRPVPPVTRRTRSSSGLATCAVCGKMASIKHELNFEGKIHKLCSDPCLNAFKFTNKLAMNLCEQCGEPCQESLHHIQYDGQSRRFCSSVCLNQYKTSKRNTVACGWCGNKNVNFDMIERIDANNKVQLFCSLNCLSLFKVNVQATSNVAIPCDYCRKREPAQYHLTMSDASVRNFCSYNCVIGFQTQFNKHGTVGQAKKIMTPSSGQLACKTRAPPMRPSLAAKQNMSSFPVISNVVSLAPGNQVALRQAAPVQQKMTAMRTAGTTTNLNTSTLRNSQTETPIQKQVIIQFPQPKPVKNKSLLCKPFTQTKATTCRPHVQTREMQATVETNTQSTQTEEEEPKKLIVPIPVPIYVPVPMCMYSLPVPYPVVMPLPIPVPCFIPTTKKNAECILKQIKEIKEKIPADPFEAELLMMAEAVANADKTTELESDSDHDVDPLAILNPEIPIDSMPLPCPSADTNINTTDPPDMANVQLGDSVLLGDEVLQLALNTSSEVTTEPPIDLEKTLDQVEDIQNNIDHGIVDESKPSRSRRGHKRSGSALSRSRTKKKLKSGDSSENTVNQISANTQPDVVSTLKYTYGVNAWKHWVIQKNSQLEKASKHNNRIKLFKTDMLQCTADELNYTLCLFIKEVRKPNGEEYAPDSIYYLCLGIQQYLVENLRIDNIFTDIYYEKFMECLNEILQRHEPRIGPSGNLMCRIEENHLWECKQLGAHSPHVLLNTLVYFNTRFFELKSPTDHQKLSFSHIMKHYKKTTLPGTKTPTRTVYLRYYAPTKDSKKKLSKDEVEIYEQCENLNNPLRCPVKLYEFYLSKCPESIKSRNDVFYLIPERCCVPDSPVWYSTSPLSISSIGKMINRIQVVKEIQEAEFGLSESTKQVDRYLE